jgi:hypothetical protein
MKAQVESFILSTSPAKQALFVINETFDVANITLAKTILNTPEAVDDEIRAKYAHPFDRLLDRALTKVRNLGAPQTTEVNVIKNGATIIGLLVRNPEPFFDPRLPDTTLALALLVITGISGPVVLYSKDRSQIFISNSTLSLSTGPVTLKFKHPAFNGETYVFDTDPSDNNPTITFSLT